MKLYLLLPVILPFFACCQQNTSKEDYFTNKLKLDNLKDNPYEFIRDIPCPKGYKRLNTETNSFAGWLRDNKLKKDKTVHLYDGSLKGNQAAQFAVIDLPVGKKDLQQCADAIMRLRAEYLYSLGQFHAIRFFDNNNTCYACPQYCSRANFETYLERVFSYCGTLSLQKQLPDAGPVSQTKAGNVIIQGGSPGHALIIVDVVVNAEGQKLYLLAQSYMPAQEMHILKNPSQTEISPWYHLQSTDIQTPEWKFLNAKLKKW
jgi:Domain of unknown function (4846)